MILCLDVGNSHLYGGVFDDDILKLTFRKSVKGNVTSDELGLFLVGVLRENELDSEDVEQISICSVVPDLVHSLRNCCKKYFDLSPFFLQAGAKTGLKIKYRNPIEVGADRIANSIAATHMFPDQDIIIIDFGTATTFCALNQKREYLGGVIVPGLRVSMESLEANTAKLPLVEIVAPEYLVGRSTVESIQSGLYYGTMGAIHEVTNRMTAEVFKNKRPMLIGTGGFSSLYEREKLFDITIPDLVLKGLFIALQLNV